MKYLVLFLLSTNAHAVSEAYCGAQSLNFTKVNGQWVCAEFTPASKAKMLERRKGHALRHFKISEYLFSVTNSPEEFDRVDMILGDTVLEGQSCESLVKGELSKQCKAEIKAQVRIERSI